MFYACLLWCECSLWQIKSDLNGASMMNMYKEGTYLILHPIVTSVQHIHIQFFLFLLDAHLFKNQNNGAELNPKTLKYCTDV